MIGEGPGQNEDLQGKAFVGRAGRLLDQMAPATARKWLEGTNAMLGNRRPLDLIADQRVAEVVAAVEQSGVDSYA